MELVVLIAQAIDIDGHKLVEPHVLGDDHVRVQDVIPTRPRERIGRRRLILDAVARRELDRHRPRRRLREAKRIGGPAEDRDVRGRTPVDEQVGRVDAGHVLREIDFNLGQ